MGIEKLDKNFALQTETNAKTALTYYQIPHKDFDLYGVAYDEDRACFARMPLSVAETVSEGVEFLSAHTAGGRIRFSTDSRTIGLQITYEGLEVMPHMPVFGQAGFTLIEETQEGRKLVKVFAPTFTDTKGFSVTAELPRGGTMRNYILYFPLYNGVRSLAIGLNADAKVGSGKKYREIKPILYYGSSITQGGCASRADNAYQAWIEKKNNIDFINLGFSGNAKAEDAMVDYLATIDCSLFVCDYDHNAPTVEYLRDTHFRLYERYRKARPDVPILFLTEPDGFRDPNGKMRAEIIRKTYLKARSKGDKQVYFLNGKRYYGIEERENCAVDGCHPNDLGFYRMAQAIYREMKRIDKQFE